MSRVGALVTGIFLAPKSTVGGKRQAAKGKGKGQRVVSPQSEACGGFLHDDEISLANNGRFLYNSHSLLTLNMHIECKSRSTKAER